MINISKHDLFLRLYMLLSKDELGRRSANKVLPLCCLK